MSATREQPPIHDEAAARRLVQSASHRYAVRAAKLRRELDELAAHDAGSEADRPSTEPAPRVEPNRIAVDASPPGAPSTSRLLTLVVMPFVLVYLAIKSAGRTVLTATPRIVEALAMATIRLVAAGGRVVVAAVDGFAAVIDVSVRGLSWLGRQVRAILRADRSRHRADRRGARRCRRARRAPHRSHGLVGPGPRRRDPPFRGASDGPGRAHRGARVGRGPSRHRSDRPRGRRSRGRDRAPAIAHAIARPLRALGRLLRELGSRIAVLGRAAGHALATAIRAVARSIASWLRVVGGAFRQLLVRAVVILRAFGHELMRPIRWTARGAVGVATRLLVLARGATRAVVASIRGLGSRLGSLAVVATQQLLDAVRRASLGVIAAIEGLGTVVAAVAIVVAAGAQVIGRAVAPFLIALLRVSRRVAWALAARARIAVGLVRGVTRDLAYAIVVVIRAAGAALRDVLRRVASPIAWAVRRAAALVRIAVVAFAAALGVATRGLRGAADALASAVGAAARAARRAIVDAARPVRAAMGAAAGRIRASVASSTVAVRQALRSAAASLRAAASEARAVARSLMHRPSRPGPTGGTPAT